MVSINGAKLFSPEQVEKAIKKIISEQLTKTIALAAPEIKSDMQKLIDKQLRSSIVMKDLVEGELRGQLGLNKSTAESAAESIVRAVVGTIDVKSKAVKISRRGNENVLSITTQPSNFKNISSILQGTIGYYSNRYKKSVNIKWIDWLLFEGDKIVVSESHYETNPRIKGRSGLGKMHKGGFFRIAPYYSGTGKDNFISRVFEEDGFQTAVSNIIQSNIQKHWK
mgnify:FL=1|tara:strand:- start:122 stop:793 length:672 start_codon:yes stop_codon:yes gene_type:complete